MRIETCVSSGDLPRRVARAARMARVVMRGVSFIILRLVKRGSVSLRITFDLRSMTGTPRRTPRCEPPLFYSADAELVGVGGGGICSVVVVMMILLYGVCFG